MFKTEFAAGNGICAAVVNQVEISEIENPKEKMKWMARFSKAYSAPLNNLDIGHIHKVSRYFVANLSGREAGFIRITDYTQEYRDVCNSEVWSVSDAYVKQAYRSKGVLWNLINYVVRNQNVRTVLIRKDSFLKNRIYYRSLGFISCLETKFGDELVFALTEEMELVLQRSRQLTTTDLYQ